MSFCRMSVFLAGLLMIGAFTPVEAGISVRVGNKHYVEGHYYPSYGWYHRGGFYRHYPGHYYGHWYYRPYYYHRGGHVYHRPHYYYGQRPGFSLFFDFGKKHSYQKKHYNRGGRHHGKHHHRGPHRRHHRR